MRCASPAVSIGETVRHISSSTPAVTNCPSSRGPPSVSSRVCPGATSASTARAGSTPTPSPAITTRAPAFSAAAIRSGARRAGQDQDRHQRRGEQRQGEVSSRLALTTAIAGAGLCPAARRSSANSARERAGRYPPGVRSRRRRPPRPPGRAGCRNAHVGRAGDGLGPAVVLGGTVEGGDHVRPQPRSAARPARDRRRRRPTRRGSTDRCPSEPGPAV